jgi:hypothetical protein
MRELPNFTELTEFLGEERLQQENMKADEGHEKFY